MRSRTQSWVAQPETATSTAGSSTAILIRCTIAFSSYPGFRIWTDCRPSDGVHRAARPVGQLVTRPTTSTTVILPKPGAKLAVMPCAVIDEVSFDQGAQAEAFVQFVRDQDAGIGGHRRAPDLDAQLRIEREANRARCRATHWVVPSASARSPREPRFLLAVGDYGVWSG